jgi:hypothetical protein
MAIFGGIPGVKVEIIVDRAPLQEYDDDSEGGAARKLSVYVEVQTGQEFALKATFKDPFPQSNVVISVALAGQSPLKTIYIAEHHLRDHDGHKISYITSRSAPYSYKQKFCFEKLEIGKHICCTGKGGKRLEILTIT